MLSNTCDMLNKCKCIKIWKEKEISYLKLHYLNSSLTNLGPVLSSRCDHRDGVYIIP